MRFKAELASASGGGRALEVPAEIAASFPSRRPAVRGTVNGVEFRSRLAVYGGRSYLGLNAQVRRAAGISLGDLVDVLLEADEESPTVEIPPELTAALTASAAAKAAYDRLAFTHRKEYAAWIAEAKRPETRERRTSKSIDMLTGGIKTPR
jgi:hypothetical protein